MAFVGEQMKLNTRSINKLAEGNRNAAYESIQGSISARRRLILDVLGNESMTVSEIVEVLLNKGQIAYFDRNYVAPRITELKDMGLLVACGSRKSTRSTRNETIWKRKEI